MIAKKCKCLLYQIEGNFEPICCAFVFQCKLLICTHLGGSFPIILRHVAICSCDKLQAHVLSSNTQKGEIERTCPEFCVLGNNTRVGLIVGSNVAGN